MTRRDIEFGAEDVTLRGWFYPAQGAPGATHATIVMTHGYSAVKEMYLDRYAEVFAAAGLNALVFDNRNFGASDGQPRQEIDPWAQIRDYRHAITFAAHTSRSRRRPHRRVGKQLLRWPRPGGGCIGPPGERGRQPRRILSTGTRTSGAWSARTSSPGSGSSSTPTGWPATTAQPRRWSRWSMRIRSHLRRCPHPTPTSGSPRPMRRWHRRGATK